MRALPATPWARVMACGSATPFSSSTASVRAMRATAAFSHTPPSTGMRSNSPCHHSRPLGLALIMASPTPAPATPAISAHQ